MRAEARARARKPMRRQKGLRFPPRQPRDVVDRLCARRTESLAIVPGHVAPLRMTRPPDAEGLSERQRTTHLGLSSTLARGLVWTCRSLVDSVVHGARHPALARACSATRPMAPR